MKKIAVNSDKAQLIMVGGVQLTREKRIMADNTSLIINYVLPRDSGTYVCLFETVDVASLEHKVNVQFAPVVKIDGNAEKSVRRGSSITLKCFVSGNPRPTLRWTRPGAPFPPGVVNKNVSKNCIIYYSFILLKFYS